jgi:hypothetical protein
MNIQNKPPHEAPRRIQVHSSDNVAIVVNALGLPAGTAFPDGLTLNHFVPQGHKVALAVLPDPVCVYGGNVARRRGRDMGKHGQRHIEMVVGMRTPAQAAVVAHLGDAYAAGHGPEMRIGQGNIHRAQFQRMGHLAPVGGHHVGGGGKSGGPAEFRQDLAARIAAFGAARIFRIGQHVTAPLAQRDGFFQ